MVVITRITKCKTYNTDSIPVCSYTSKDVNFSGEGM